MIDRERQQADLLAQFRQDLGVNPDQAPPDDLDPGVAGIAVMLEDELSPPNPSARFVQMLDNQLTAQATRARSHRQPGALPPSSGELSAAAVPTDWQASDERPRSRRSEFARIAAAGLAVMLVGLFLVLLFNRDDDSPSAPAIGGTPGTSNEILVSWDPEGGENHKLYIIDVTGENEPRKLTPEPHEDDDVTEILGSWSPDGQKVVYARREGAETTIVVVNADGSGTPTVIEGDGSTITLPVWSPDGSQIAYVANQARDFETNIYVVNADGSNARQLTDLPSGALYPAWSPDGSQIAFSATRGDLLDLWVMNADGSEQRPVAELVGVLGQPYWSPDGEHIAFELGDQIWTVAPDGSELQVLVDGTEALMFPGSTTTGPDWSPDGQQIAYAHGTAPESDSEIVVVGIDGDVQQQWTSDCNHEWAPTWAPDGNRMAFYCGSDPDPSGNDPFANAAWGLRVADADGTNERTLLTGGIFWFLAPEWRPIADDGTPTPEATPTVLPTVTPLPSVPTLTVPTEPPGAWLAFEDQTQESPAWSYCWPTSRGGTTCMEFDADPPDGPALHVPAGASMTFGLHEIEDFAITNAFVHPLVPRSPDTADEFSWGYPTVDVPFDHSPNPVQITADLPAGEYALAVEVEIPVLPDRPGEATYYYRISVTDAPTGIEIDPFAPAFPDAEVVHVVTVMHTESAHYQNTMIIDTWIDQISGGAVSYHEEADGLVSITHVRQGLTAWEHNLPASHLKVTTVLEPDDPMLPDPAHHLNLFRWIFGAGEAEFRSNGGEITLGATYEGREAIKLVLPLTESDEVYGEAEAYLHPDTLFPMAIMGPGDEIQTYTYRTVETLDRSDVEDDIFSSKKPEADNTYIDEKLSVDSARAFSDFPVWWLGEEIDGYPLERITHSLRITEHGISPEQHVHILYRPSPDSPDIRFQVLSQGPLSEQEESARSTSRDRATEIEFHGNHGWLYADPLGVSRIEIEFPDGYVTVHLSDPEDADAVLESLTRMGEGP